MDALLNWGWNGTLNFITMLGLFALSILKNKLLPAEGNELWGYTALALTLTWILGIEKVRNFFGRFSHIALGVIICLTIYSVWQAKWAEAGTGGHIVLGAILGLGIVGLIGAIVASLPAIAGMSFLAMFRKSKGALNPNPGILSCILGATLAAGIINGENLANRTHGLASIASALFGVGFIAWRGWKFYENRTKGGGEKPKKPKKEDELVGKAKAETPANSDAGAFSFTECPKCSEETMGEKFCTNCGHNHKRTTTSRRRSPKTRQARRNF